MIKTKNSYVDIEEVDYYPSFLSQSEASELFSALKEIRPKATETFHMASGRTYKLETPKFTFLDEGIETKPVFTPEIWGNSGPWSEAILPVKEKIESMLGHHFQVGVVLYYPNGNVISPYHTDPRSYGNTDFIPSLSLGATRTFGVKEMASGMEFIQPFYSGDLVVMKPGCQERYEHAILEDPSVDDLRINITFRKCNL